MEKKPPQPCEFAIGREDNVLYIKYGGVANENVSYYGFCFKFEVVLSMQLQVA